MRNALLINPKSGRGSAGRISDSVGRQLAASGHDFEVLESTAPGDLTRLARDACMQGCELLVVCGGDGAIHEAINGVVQADADPLFSFIPCGTGNDFRKVTHVPRDWQQATTYLIDRLNRDQPPRRIDLGICNDHVFNNGCGMGFDAQVNQIASGYKKLQGNAVYGFALLKRLVLGVENTRAQIYTDDEHINVNITLIVVNNGSHTGGMFHIAPQASVQDGLLEVVYATDLTRLDVLKLAPHVIRGTHLGRNHVHSMRCKKIRIAPERSMPVQIDGEMMEHDQAVLDIKVLPGRLRLLG